MTKKEVKLNRNGPVVCKFGGTSVANANQIRKVDDIVKSDSLRRYIVVSAPGKQNPDDKKITNLLYHCYAVRNNSNILDEIFGLVEEKFLSIVDDLGLSKKFSDSVLIYLLHMRDMLEAEPSEDEIVSRGEFLNAKILAEYLGYEFVDAKELINFDDDGKLDEELTRIAIADRLAETERAVIPGFYGIDAHGKIKLLPRGGSDTTGALVAEAVNASVYENWTDVPGLHRVDPKIIPSTKHVREITYQEMRELSYAGAAVLAPDAVLPVLRANIPINIRNTNAPLDPGTTIVRESSDSPMLFKKTPVTAIAGRKDFTVITLSKIGMHEEVGYIEKVAKIFQKRGVSVENIPGSIDTLSPIIETSILTESPKELFDENGEVIPELFINNLEALLHDFGEELQTNSSDISVENNLALITVVGVGMANTPGVAQKIFTALGNAQINVRLILQGPSELNVTIGVTNENYEKAIRAIYKKFFGKWYKKS